MSTHSKSKSEDNNQREQHAAHVWVHQACFLVGFV
jgi:hypothetical protein